MERICCIFGAGAYGGTNARCSRPAPMSSRRTRATTACGTSASGPTLPSGDFDSMGAPPDDVPVVRHPAEKGRHRYAAGRPRGVCARFSRFYLFGGTGGRIDHTLANLQTLAFIAERAASASCSGTTDRRSRKNGTLGFPAGLSGTVSVFALGSPARGVTSPGCIIRCTRDADARVAAGREQQRSPARPPPSRSKTAC